MAAIHRSDGKISFPRSLGFGTASAAAQVEGHHADTVTDIGVMAKLHSEHHEYGVDGEYMAPIGNAIDHYHRYPEDLQQLKDLGLMEYRFSIEWERIEPRQTGLHETAAWDEAEIQHYREVLEKCRELGITPTVTLQHFTTPKWLYREGGWDSTTTPDYFARYAKLVTQRYGDLIAGRSSSEPSGMLFTLNEVNTGLLNEFARGTPQERLQRPAWKASAQAMGVPMSKFHPWKLAWTQGAIETIVKSHQKAFWAIKSVRDDVPVGLTMASQSVVPLDPDNVDHVRGADAFWHAREGRFWQLLEQQPESIGDVIGIQPYTHLRVGNAPDGRVGILPPPPGGPLVAQGYEYTNEALDNCLRLMHRRHPDRDLVVTEFGIGTKDDRLRVQYYRDNLMKLADCLEDGINVRKFFGWTGWDNFEWGHAYEAPYGLIAVDFKTQERTPKASAEFYSRIARTRELIVPEAGHDLEIKF